MKLEAINAEPSTAQHADETLQQAGEAAAHGADAAHGSGGVDVLHHVLDSNVFDIGPLHIPLPSYEVFGSQFITKHVVVMWIAAALLMAVLIPAARRASSPVPGRVRNLVEIFVAFIRDEIALKTIPHHGHRYVGYLLTTFFFIAVCNLLGLVPGLATATGNISVTAALALLAFVQIQWGGIRENGFWGHLKHLAPPGVPAWLLVIMIPVEFLGMLIKPFALCIRLFANMMAGHVAIGAFIGLIFIMADIGGAMAGFIAAPFAVGFALFVNCLEVMIALIQAYVFTILTATFIGMSIHPH